MWSLMVSALPFPNQPNLAVRGEIKLLVTSSLGGKRGHGRAWHRGKLNNIF